MLQKNLDWCFATLIETLQIKMTYLTFLSLYTKTRKNNTLLFFEFIYKTARKKIRLYKGKKTKI